MKSFRIINFKTIGDERGSLISLELGHDFLFEIKRIYYIFDTKEEVERGFHAHINLKQIIIPVKGSCTFVLDNGIKRENIRLTSPTKGLFIEGLIWREMKDFSPDCVLVILASEHYDETDYIRNYNKFMEKINASS